MAQDDTSCSTMAQDDTSCDLFAPGVANTILSLPLEDLQHAVSFRKDPIIDLKLACRDMNNHLRSDYSKFIHSVGRNIFPLIIATDASPGLFGVGTTFTLFLEDGTEEKITPALSSHYEVYKSVSHIFLGAAVLITPFLSNPGSQSWLNPVKDFISKMDVALSAVNNIDGTGSLNVELLINMLLSVKGFLIDCIKNKKLDFAAWNAVNDAGFAMIKRCMEHATAAQAEANIPALLEWKRRLGAELWSKVYVVIPTVWPVAGNNPRLEMFKKILDSDKVESHIICSEWPRGVEEGRDLLGRVVGDRAIGRMVFGTSCSHRRTKTVALSTPVDAVMDDAVTNIERVFAQLK